jgi:hypothetical protein
MSARLGTGKDTREFAKGTHPGDVTGMPDDRCDSLATAASEPRRTRPDFGPCADIHVGGRQLVTHSDRLIVRVPPTKEAPV